jgi:hypothetical protein
MFSSKEERIAAFKERIKVEPDFCRELFEYATVRLLACKYAYYVENKPFLKDIAYDGEEESWYIMGRALGLLKEDETSPCVDWNENHPKAKEGVALALTLMEK